MRRRGARRWVTGIRSFPAPVGSEIGPWRGHCARGRTSRWSSRGSCSAACPPTSTASASPPCAPSGAPPRGRSVCPLLCRCSLSRTARPSTACPRESRSASASLAVRMASPLSREKTDFATASGRMTVRSCTALQQFHSRTSKLQIVFSLAVYQSSEVPSKIHFSECQLLPVSMKEITGQQNSSIGMKEITGQQNHRPDE
uniref:Uncharacterized protein n=1 Tax=Setaria viridis TaxID=4556 RepID=A0A4U6TM46_SETVI|nr:hypothetical protein SEVIR_8G192000v2 [Setaria viridis]